MRGSGGIRAGWPGGAVLQSPSDCCWSTTENSQVIFALFFQKTFLQRALQGMCSEAGRDSLVCSDLKESVKNHFVRGICILCLSLTPLCFCTELSFSLFSPALLNFILVERLTDSSASSSFPCCAESLV